MRDHGTRAAYVHGIAPGSDRANGCRCEACCEANRTYARMQTKRLVRERAGKRAPRLVDATEAREHLRWLLARGIGLRTVAQRTGLGRTAIQEIRNGTTRRVAVTTAERILEVWPADAADGAYVDARATWRLIDDLLAHGWTRSRIAAALGSRAKAPALQLGRDRVTAAHARAVAELHATALADVLLERRNKADERARYRRQEHAA